MKLNLVPHIYILQCIDLPNQLPVSPILVSNAKIIPNSTRLVYQNHQSICKVS
jgi:hypothetical protein